MAEINQEPATKLKAKSLRMAGKAICALPTCVAARMPAKMARNTINHAVAPVWAVAAGCWPGGEAPAAVGIALFSPEGAKEPAVFSPEGRREDFFKVGFCGLWVGSFFKGGGGERKVFKDGRYSMEGRRRRSGRVVPVSGACCRCRARVHPRRVGRELWLPALRAVAPPAGRFQARIEAP